MSISTLLARHHRDLYGRTAWLNENPSALGVILITLGLLSLACGVWELKTGRYHTRCGTIKEGHSAFLYGFVHVIVGAGLILFGAGKLFTALS